MKKNKALIYVAAWLTYLTFAFIAYPELQITVMLYSIPLTMTGGWLYTYRGAVMTTLLTVPAHYLLLQIHSDDPQVVMEAVNPFGIGTQLLFSSVTALLKTSSDRFHKLNDSLANLVAERTADLEKLTNYLIDARQLEIRELNASLLEQPYKELKSMLAISFLLKQKLASEGHPRSADADNIHEIFGACMKQLQSIEDYSISSVPISDDIEVSIQNLIQQVGNVSTTRISMETTPLWRSVKPEISTYLCEIIFEAVSNALRHADPREIRIGAHHSGSGDIFHIENDGLPLPSKHKEGMGIPLMRYRATKIGAELSISRTNENKTRVEIQLKKAFP